MMRMACDGSLSLESLIACQEPLTEAVLRRCGFEDIALTISDGILTPAVPPARGVWALQITSNCGCYIAPISVENCPAPAFSSTHDETAGNGSATVCCETED